MYRILVALVVFLFFLVPGVHANTATLSGTSYSILLDDTAANMSGSLVYFFFTTYDGDRYGMPYYYDANSQMIYYSQELKKVGTLYKTDYFSIVDNYIDDYGEVSLNLGNIDSDHNGIDDICEKQKAINLSVSGNWYSQDDTSGSISGSMNRNAGSQLGSYNLSINNTWAGNIPLSGNFYSGILSGSISYSTGNNTFLATYTSTWAVQSQVKHLDTTYEILDENRIRMNAKDFFPATIFNRSGNTYSAVVVLTDGEPSTFWAEYQKWFIVITDNNDFDGDGIPDLSDTTDNSKKPYLPFLPLLLE